MRAYAAALRTETNSFVERLTTLTDFHAGAYAPAGNSPVCARTYPGCAAMIAAAKEAGYEVVRGPVAYAVPGGPVSDEAYAVLKSAILDSLRDSLPVNLVLLDLHGAMAAQSVDDCEGDLLAAVREVVGQQAVIVALLDLHATLSPMMVESADLLHAYKEYPHTDVAERGRELFRVAHTLVRDEVRPVAAVAECRVLGGFPTAREPMKGFVRSLVDMEKREGGILSVSLIHGFPWSDSSANGAKVLVYADGDSGQADGIARTVAQRFALIAAEAVEHPVPIRDAIEQLAAHPDTRFILADASDNPGGGADGDAMHLLAALRAAGCVGIGAALIHDPRSMAACLQAGVGAQLTLTIGGQMSRYSGDPIVVEGVVAGIAERVERGPEDAAAGPPVGPIARFSTRFADFILCGSRREALWPGLFTATGADPLGYRTIVLKSSTHFRASFAPLADRVLSVGSPTAMNPDLASLPFSHLPRPIWPLDSINLAALPLTARDR